MDINKTVYLIPGRGNTLSDLGKIVISLGFDVCGRELAPPFSTLRFPQQLEIIRKDLKTLFWSIDAKLAGHSYGGYLLLHALSELPAFPGKIILFSPVLGAAADKRRLYMSRPPRADKLLDLATRSQFPVPQWLEIHTGANDEGCDPDLAKKIGDLIEGTKVSIIPDQGHALPNAYIKEALHRFFADEAHAVRIRD